MKREYQLTISRTDRIYLIVLVCVLLGWELIKNFIPETVLVETSEPTIILETDTTDLQTDFSRQGKSMHKKYSGRTTPYLRKEELIVLPEEQLQPVKIMDASPLTLQAVGFSQQVANNIAKYREAGGQIKNKADAMKIYGMDSAQWNRVSSFILFPQEEITKSDHSYIPNRYLPKRILDLNTANATDLDSLPGIGPVFAERLIALRNSLGGFLYVNQIKTCYGIPPETIDKILPLVTIEEPVQRKDVNTIDWATFEHPYLKKKFSAMIQAYQKNHGPFKTPEDFRKVFPPDTSWCDALLPYLRFSAKE